MDFNQQQQGNSFFRSWLDWSRHTVTLRLSLLLAVGAGLHLLSVPNPQAELPLFLLELGVFGAAIMLVEGLSLLKSSPRKQALAASICMISFILVSGLSVTGPGNFMLLLIPIVNTALRADYRFTLLVTIVCGIIWMFLRSLTGNDADIVYIARLAELLPLVLVAVVIKALSGDVLTARNRITALSYRDELTGLLNMRAFTRLLQSEHQKAEIVQAGYALLLIDIDGLQALNDKYGHEQGNRALVAVANALTRSIRSIDLLARYGGDEFIIYLSGADAAAAQEVCNRVSQNVYNITLSFERKMQRIEVNVGVAIYPDGGSSIKEIMSGASEAMYRDKKFRRSTSADKGDAEVGRAQAGIENWD